MIAMDALDYNLAVRVSHSWEHMDGQVELWKCPTCKRVVATEMRKGVRQDAGFLIVGREVNL